MDMFYSVAIATIAADVAGLAGHLAAKNVGKNGFLGAQVW
jgi:hypothetical protein